MFHKPAEGAFDDPAARQHFKAGRVIGTFNHFDFQFGAPAFDPRGESLAGVAAIHPEPPQPGEPLERPVQHRLRARAFGRAGGGDGHPEHQPQGVDQQMPLAAFDPLGRVVAHVPAVTGGLDALAVQNGGGGLARPPVGFPNQGAQRVVERRPVVIDGPFAKDIINRLPGRKVVRQQPPGDAPFDHVQHRIQNPPPVRGRTSAFGRFGEQRFQIVPLGLGKTRVIYGDFHASSEAAL